MASIAFPADLPPPLRSGYEDAFEDIRVEFPPEIGPSRRRNRMRVAPRLIAAEWNLSDAEFSVFDRWWQTGIQGGALEFDILLADDVSALAWYTVRALEPYRAEVTGELRWSVRMRLRAISESFGTVRIAGTDELAGRSSIGVTVARGDILVYAPLQGRGMYGVSSAFVRMQNESLQGRLSIGLFKAIAVFGIFPYSGESAVGVIGATGNILISTYYPELSRQWADEDWLNGISAEDLNLKPEAIQREWMEI